MREPEGVGASRRLRRSRDQAQHRAPCPVTPRADALGTGCSASCRRASREALRLLSASGLTGDLGASDTAAPTGDLLAIRAPVSRRAASLTPVSAPDHEARLAAVEARVEELAEQARAAREDAAAARHLAAANDRDVAEIRDDLRAFRQATALTMNEMREDLGTLRAETQSGFAEMRSKLDQSAAGQERIAGLLTSLIEGGQDER